MQAATFAQPYLCAQQMLKLAHAVTERRLGQAQAFGGGSERALALYFANDAQMAAFYHWLSMNINH